MLTIALFFLCFSLGSWFFGKGWVLRQDPQSRPLCIGMLFGVAALGLCIGSVVAAEIGFAAPREWVTIEAMGFHPSRDARFLFRGIGGACCYLQEGNVIYPLDPPIGVVRRDASDSNDVVILYVKEHRLLPNWKWRWFATYSSLVYRGYEFSVPADWPPVTAGFSTEFPPL